MGLFGLFSKEKEKKTVSAVIVAAGSSSRMGGENKLLMEFCGLPVLVHTLRAFEDCLCIDEVVLCCREQDIPVYHSLCQNFSLTKVKKIVVGGETRGHSVLAGLLELDPSSRIVAIHDGARPLITGELIENTVAAAAKSAAAALAVKSKDSIQRCQNGLLVGNVDRDSVVLVQTPQVFDTDLIKGALTKAIAGGVSLTDDLSAVALLGVSAQLVEGSYENLKITTPEDLTLAEGIYMRRLGI